MCHLGLYDYTKQVEEMVKNIDEKTVPKCPKCEGKMFCNIRCDEYFVKGEVFNNGQKNYSEFIKKIQGKKVVLLELGVGFNTPVIIRFPFEKVTSQNENFHLVRLKMNELECIMDIDDKVTLIPGDMEKS